MTTQRPSPKPAANKPKTKPSGALPAWKVVAALAAATLLIGFIGWRVTNAAREAQRPDLPVHAGMYNLRAELQKGRRSAAPAPPVRP